MRPVIPDYDWSIFGVRVNINLDSDGSGIAGGANTLIVAFGVDVYGSADSVKLVSIDEQTNNIITNTNTSLPITFDKNNDRFTLAVGNQDQSEGEKTGSFRLGFNINGKMNYYRVTVSYRMEYKCYYELNGQCMVEDYIFSSYSLSMNKE